MMSNNRKKKRKSNNVTYQLGSVILNKDELYDFGFVLPFNADVGGDVYRYIYDVQMVSGQFASYINLLRNDKVYTGVRFNAVNGQETVVFTGNTFRSNTKRMFIELEPLISNPLSFNITVYDNSMNMLFTDYILTSNDPTGKQNIGFLTGIDSSNNFYSHTMTLTTIVHSIKIYRNDVLFKDYVFAKVNENATANAALYDKLSKTILPARKYVGDTNEYYFNFNE